MASTCVLRHRVDQSTVYRHASCGRGHPRYPWMRQQESRFRVVVDLLALDPLPLAKFTSSTPLYLERRAQTAPGYPCPVSETAKKESLSRFAVGHSQQTALFCLYLFLPCVRNNNTKSATKTRTKRLRTQESKTNRLR